MLPLDNILELMVVIKGLLENNWDIELASRILVLAVRINLPQLLSSPKAAPLVRSMAKLLPKRIKEFKVCVLHSMSLVAVISCTFLLFFVNYELSFAFLFMQCNEYFTHLGSVEVHHV